MKTILLWDPRFPQSAPARLALDDALASACVRAGVAAAANPSEQGALAAGDGLDPGNLLPALVECDAARRLARVMLPASVVAIGVRLGICVGLQRTPAYVPPSDPPGVVSPNYTADLSGAAGTTLDKLPGWAISRTGAGAINMPALDGAGHLNGVNNGGSSLESTWAVLYDTGASLAGSTLTFTARCGLAEQTATSRISYYFGNDYANGCGFSFFCQNNTINQPSDGSYTRMSGTNTQLTKSWSPSITVTGRANGTFDIKFEFSADGKSVKVSMIGATTSVATFDLSGITLGNKFGFSGLSAYIWAFQTTQSLSAMSYAKPLTTLTVTDAPAYTATNTASYSLSWSGRKPDKLQHRLYDASGNPVTDWIEGVSVVTGDTSGTVSYAAASPVTGALFPRFRVYSDTVCNVQASNSTYYGANVQPFEMGYNLGGGNYYTPIVMLNNWGKFILVSGGSVYIPYAGINGTATIKTDIGVKFSGAYDSTGAVTILSSDPATGTHRISIANDMPTAERRLIWSGTAPTYLEVTRDGQTGKTAPEWIAGVEGKWLRNLDMEADNFVPVIPVAGQKLRPTPDDKSYQTGFGNTSCVIPYQDVADAIAAKMAANPDFVGLWDVHGVDLTDADITARATYQRDTLPPRAKIALEFGNEQPWNDAFPGVRRLMADAIRGGWFGAATASTPVAGRPIQYYIESVAATNTASPAASTGERLFCGYEGLWLTVWRAKTNVPAGSPIAENSYWTRETDLADVVTFARRWRSVRHNQIIEIYRSVFGEERFQAQIVPVVMGQQANGNVYASLATERTFVPGYWDKIKGVGYAFYFNHETSLDPATATAASIEASFRVAMVATKATITQAVRDAVNMGKTPMFYEGMTHPSWIPYQSNPNYKAAWDDLFSSDLGRQLMSDIAYFMKSTVPGVAMGFTLVGERPWALRNTWADTSNKRYIGWREGLARS